MTVMSFVMCLSLSSSFYLQNLRPTLSRCLLVIKAASLVTCDDLEHTLLNNNGNWTKLTSKDVIDFDRGWIGIKIEITETISRRIMVGIS